MSNFHYWLMNKMPSFRPLQQVFKRSYKQCVVKLEMVWLLLFDSSPYTIMIASFSGFADWVYLQLVDTAYAI